MAVVRCPLVCSVILVLVVQRSDQAPLQNLEFRDGQFLCSYDPETGSQICKEEDLEESSTMSECDYKHCFRQWADVRTSIHNNRSSGVPFSTNLEQWSSICDDSAINEVELCINEELMLCTKDTPDNELLVTEWTHFCQDYGKTAYLKLNAVHCSPSHLKDMCIEQAKIQADLTNIKFPDGENYFCVFEHFYHRCHRDEMLAQCGPEYVEFIDVLNTDYASDIDTNCSHIEVS
ncbi:uncharacterized protein LOC106077225 [Biomphalaria glabrata]|uniref:Uncharacterized protein LOC106077225 n=1 Tax=Biomphalaria glabrata TaxID=6526 RepID=A0A9U8ELZ6_BIOGL|nr:uncharacterized protein LOC106077225 [Biomphalaria glabrata]